MIKSGFKSWPRIQKNLEGFFNPALLHGDIGLELPKKRSFVRTFLFFFFRFFWGNSCKSELSCLVQVVAPSERVQNVSPSPVKLLRR